MLLVIFFILHAQIFRGSKKVYSIDLISSCTGKRTYLIPFDLLILCVCLSFSLIKGLYQITARLIKT